jgi:transposase
MKRIRTPVGLHLNHHDRRRLEKALNHSRTARLFRRLQAVLLVAQGRAVAEVATIVQVSQRAVYLWVNRYLASRQPQALADAPRSGRPVTAQQLTDECLERELRRDPLQLGYNTTGWTVALLATHLNQVYDCAITPRTLRRRLHQLGWRWKRPRYVYSGKEPHRAQKKGP